MLTLAQLMNKDEIDRLNRKINYYKFIIEH